MVFWYTTALPSNISPIPCNLLNGAILELHAHRLHYTAKAVHFKKIENVSVALPQEGVKMTVGTEEKMIDRYMLQRD
jgi:hypothetical protein